MSRRCHYPKMIRGNGDVSPLCATKPRKIDVSRASWTFQEDDVNCPKCLAIMRSTDKKEWRVLKSKGAHA